MHVSTREDTYTYVPQFTLHRAQFPQIFLPLTEIYMRKVPPHVSEQTTLDHKITMNFKDLLECGKTLS